MKAFSTESEGIAWLVGLLEGEGSFFISPVGRAAPNGKRYWRSTVAIKMTDEDVVARAAQIAGCGSIRGPYTYGKKKPFWLWETSNKADVLRFLEMVFPYLGARRQAQAQLVLDRLRSGLVHLS